MGLLFCALAVADLLHSTHTKINISNKWCFSF